MAVRRLDAEEHALWDRVAATVTPLGGRGTVTEQVVSPAKGATSISPARAVARKLSPARATIAAPRPAADTLDGGWDRRLRRGAVMPDRAIDLHGHTLATAHAALEQALADALADDLRVLLVVTGKPPRHGEVRRGLIRASIDIWLAGLPQRSRIAAVRNAHPRHGGAGALYLIFRRRRGG